ncbi:MAG: hypothetical protein HUK23_05375 [Sphaerochaetaceae bacterium]|mgnify:CR=1 FL=1|nr:hypothetical protein [Sphaerochaetaceae bacterium]
MVAVRNYDVHLDNKNRLTIRGAKYSYYNVREYDNGCVMLEPRELTMPEGVTKETLEDMDKAVQNFKSGKVYGPIDLSVV